MITYMITAPISAFRVENRAESFANQIEQGTATICVTSSARIMPVEPRPSVEP